MRQITWKGCWCHAANVRRRSGPEIHLPYTLPPFIKNRINEIYVLVWLYIIYPGPETLLSTIARIVTPQDELWKTRNNRQINTSSELKAQSRNACWIGFSMWRPLPHTARFNSDHASPLTPLCKAEYVLHNIGTIFVNVLFQYYRYYLYLL